MKTTSGQKIKIGLFVVIGLVVILLGIFFIGNQKSMFNSTFSVYGMFKNVNGLQVGNNARFAGINVGVVEDISIANDTMVKVTLTLNSDVRKFIKKDSKLSIGSDGLMGDKLITIGPGTSQQVDNGDRLASVNPFDMDKLIVKVTRIVDNAEALTDNLTGVVSKINHGKGSLGRLLNNDKMARELEGTVRQAKTTIQNVHSTTSTLNEDLKAAQHNFLLRGYFKKKAKAEKKAAAEAAKP